MRVMHRTDRVVLRMFGRDPLKMIQGLATNDITNAPIGASVYTAFLTPKGKLIGVARAVRRENGDVWIEAESAAADNIAAAFKKSIPPLFAKFEFANLQVIELLGENAMETAAALPHDVVLANPFRADAADVIVPGHGVDEVMQQGAGRPVSPEEREIMRVAAGEPKWGAELTEETIPLEAGLRHVAISESKGCYTGQEVIVRILHRGHVNRHLRQLQLADSEVPAAGAQITSNDKTVGQVTSAARSNDHGIALGYVRREVAVGSEVQVAGHNARVQELPWAR